MERTHPEPVPITDPVGCGSVVDQRLEMWASRALNIAYMPRCDNWHNPSLFSGTLREAVYSRNPPVIPQSPSKDGVADAANPDCLPVWYWRVEPTFAAWCVRAIHRAGNAKISLPGKFHEALTLVREEIEGQGVKWDDIERAARGPPIVLPGSEILLIITNHARYGLCPKWMGWEKDAAKLDAADAARTEAVDVDRMRAGLASVSPSSFPCPSDASRSSLDVVQTIGHGPNKRPRRDHRQRPSPGGDRGLFE